MGAVAVAVAAVTGREASGLDDDPADDEGNELDEEALFVEVIGAETLDDSVQTIAKGKNVRALTNLTGPTICMPRTTEAVSCAGDAAAAGVPELSEPTALALSLLLLFV
jgi:hypothetical protein